MPLALLVLLFFLPDMALADEGDDESCVQVAAPANGALADVARVLDEKCPELTPLLEGTWNMSGSTAHFRTGSTGIEGSIPGSLVNVYGGRIEDGVMKFFWARADCKRAVCELRVTMDEDGCFAGASGSCHLEDGSSFPAWISKVDQGKERTDLVAQTALDKLLALWERYELEPDEEYWKAAIGRGLYENVQEHFPDLIPRPLLYSFLEPADSSEEECRVTAANGLDYVPQSFVTVRRPHEDYSDLGTHDLPSVADIGAELIDDVMIPLSRRVFWKHFANLWEVDLPYIEGKNRLKYLHTASEHEDNPIKQQELEQQIQALAYELAILRAERQKRLDALRGEPYTNLRSRLSHSVGANYAQRVWGTDPETMFGLFGKVTVDFGHGETRGYLVGNKGVNYLVRLPDLRCAINRYYNPRDIRLDNGQTLKQALDEKPLLTRRDEYRALQKQWAEHDRETHAQMNDQSHDRDSSDPTFTPARGDR